MRADLVSLTLAVGCLIGGAGMLLWDWVHPGAPALRIRWTNWSAGWLLLLLALYNLARWWAGRSARHAEQALAQARRPREARPRPAREPDTAFDFTEPADPQRSQAPEQS